MPNGNEHTQPLTPDEIDELHDWVEGVFDCDGAEALLGAHGYTNVHVGLSAAQLNPNGQVVQCIKFTMMSPLEHVGEAAVESHLKEIVSRLERVHNNQRISWQAQRITVAQAGQNITAKVDVTTQIVPLP